MSGSGAGTFLGELAAPNVWHRFGNWSWIGEWIGAFTTSANVGGAHTSVGTHGKGGDKDEQEEEEV